MKSKLTPEEGKRLVQLYKDGKSTVELSEVFGISKGAVYSRIKSYLNRSRSQKEAYKTKYPDGRFGVLASNWRGGKRRAGEYWYIYKPKHPNSTKEGYVMEHRLVMEKHLGRYLDPDEIVHHKNGVKDDNHITNLQLFDRLGDHVSEHFRLSKEVEGLKAENQKLKEEIECLRNELRFS